MVWQAKTEECFSDTQSPGQKPRPATISPSAVLPLWLEPTVAPAAMLLCPPTQAAMRKELLWCCSWAGKIRLQTSSQQETVLLSPSTELKKRTPPERVQPAPVAKFSAMQPPLMRLPGPTMPLRSTQLPSMCTGSTAVEHTQTLSMLTAQTMVHAGPHCSLSMRGTLVIAQPAAISGLSLRAFEKASSLCCSPQSSGQAAIRNASEQRMPGKECTRREPFSFMTSITGALNPPSAVICPILKSRQSFPIP